MKKSTLLTTLAFAFVMLCSVNSNAQKFAKLDKSPLDVAYYRTDRNAPPMAKVIYSRPQLNGRALATLAPNGKVWRTGANEASEIKFYKDSKFGGKDVKAGTYALYTIPGEKEWTVILSSDTDVWGAYNYNESKDVLRVTAPVTQGEAVEAFSIAFDNDKMFLAWDTTRVAVPISQ
ncbi:DUF2911 domain-containing protein [Aestuariibaculum suncheonense]|uniref:DUF2911 domain-containing protein n=1 Tax=Aestuariibaculum suncheonense TaxID=1028745 RepID=A0A8J6UIC9_9FLAO|nr:DUF2911 domain-containing protein [Aestuariibaculum suncheonense]MBD0836459.1 DUF2911 domain-containing protein [Aestuariibaculum suncheonense]